MPVFPIYRVTGFSLSFCWKVWSFSFSWSQLQRLIKSSREKVTFSHWYGVLLIINHMKHTKAVLWSYCVLWSWRGRLPGADVVSCLFEIPFQLSLAFMWMIHSDLVGIFVWHRCCIKRWGMLWAHTYTCTQPFSNGKKKNAGDFIFYITVSTRGQIKDDTL